VPVSKLTRLDGPGATPQEATRAAPMPDSLRGFQTIPGHTRHAPPSLANSLYLDVLASFDFNKIINM